MGLEILAIWLLESMFGLGVALLNGWDIHDIRVVDDSCCDTSSKA